MKCFYEVRCVTIPRWNFNWFLQYLLVLNVCKTEWERKALKKVKRQMMRTLSTASYSKWLLYHRIFPQALRRKRSRGSVVCIAAGCGLDVLNPGRGKFFSFSNRSDKLSGQPNLLSFCGVKAADEWSWLPPSRVEVKNEWRYTSISPIFHHGLDKGKFTFTFIQRNWKHVLCLSTNICEVYVNTIWKEKSDVLL